VKKTIGGCGHCEKAQIRMMIGVCCEGGSGLRRCRDALAIAVCHAHHRQSAVLKASAP